MSLPKGLSLNLGAAWEVEKQSGKEWLFLGGCAGDKGTILLLVPKLEVDESLEIDKVACFGVSLPPLPSTTTRHLLHDLALIAELQTKTASIYILVALRTFVNPSEL